MSSHRRFCHVVVPQSPIRGNSESQDVGQEDFHLRFHTVTELGAAALDVVDPGGEGKVGSDGEAQPPGFNDRA